MSITKQQADNTLTMIWFIAKDTKTGSRAAQQGNVFNLDTLRWDNKCGTSACLCGWLPAVDPRVEITHYPGYLGLDYRILFEREEVDGYEAIQNSLGLDEDLAWAIYDGAGVFFELSTQRKEVCRALCKHLKKNGYLAPTLKELGF